MVRKFSLRAYAAIWVFSAILAIYATYFAWTGTAFAGAAADCHSGITCWKCTTQCAAPNCALCGCVSFYTMKKCVPTEP